VRAYPSKSEGKEAHVKVACATKGLEEVESLILAQIERWRHA
jgi:hypothetical protein